MPKDFQRTTPFLTQDRVTGRGVKIIRRIFWRKFAQNLGSYFHPLSNDLMECCVILHLIFGTFFSDSSRIHPGHFRQVIINPARIPLLPVLKFKNSKISQPSLTCNAISSCSPHCIHFTPQLLGRAPINLTH